MTAPIPEEQDQPPLPTGTPPGEHGSELVDPADAGARGAEQEETQEQNAETSLDEPSDDAGGQ
ncbi:hypothetical protein [Nocardioides sp.]|uniref:hypothetical protein n=1 Tax=Nocardioides sp. TaxID=35761 RepID=UPI0037830E67